MLDKEQVKKILQEEKFAKIGYCMCCGNMGPKKRNDNWHKDKDRNEIRMIFKFVEVLEKILKRGGLHKT